MVLGHTSCGAIKAACDDVKLGNLTQLLQKIKPAVNIKTQDAHLPEKQTEEFLLDVTQKNITLTKNHIYQNSEILKTMIDSGEIGLVGAYYDVKTGIVKLENESP